MSYEALIIRLGKDRLGAFPVDLQVRLLSAVSVLSAKQELPSEGDLVDLLSKINSWSAFILLLERRGRPESNKRSRTLRSFVQSAGSAIAARVKRMLAGTH